MTKWWERGVATRLSVALAVAALTYLAYVCAWLAAALLAIGVVEGAWGVAGVLGMAAHAGSIAGGLTATSYVRRDDLPVRRLVAVDAGTIVLMVAGALLLALQLR